MKKTLLTLLISFTIIAAQAQTLPNTSWICYNTSNVLSRYYYFSSDTLFFGLTPPPTVPASIFMLNGDTMSIHDVLGPCAVVTGTYTYVIQNDTLLFTVINDSCAGRLNILSNFHFVRNTTGINDLNSLQSVEIFPNPAVDGIINLKYDLKENMNTVATVHNSLGETVFEKRLSENDGTESIDLHQLSPGIYFLNLHNTNNSRVFRIVR